MQPFQYDLRSSAAKDNSITHAAAAPSNLDAATTMRSAEIELQNAKELHASAMASEIAAPKPDRRQSDKKTILKHFLKGILKGKLLAPKLRKSADKSLSQPWCSHSNTIYDLQLQKTIVLRMQPRHQATLTQPVPCVSRHHVANLHLSTHRTTPEHQMTRVMQPFQCDLQAQIPKHPITTQRTHKHTQSSLKPPLQCGKKKGKPTPAATVAQTRYLSSSPAATLHGKTQGFVLRLPPQNIAHATSCSHYNAVRSINLQTRTYLRTEQHQNTRWQESCSQSNAICKHRFQNTL